MDEKEGLDGGLEDEDRVVVGGVRQLAEAGGQGRPKRVERQLVGQRLKNAFIFDLNIFLLDRLTKSNIFSFYKKNCGFSD